MVVLPYAFHQDVVHVKLHILSNLMHDHSIHQPLVRGARIESKWHHFVTKETLTDYK